MTRETAINILLGTILIVACALPFVAGLLLLYGLNLGVKHFLPGLAKSEDAILFGILCLTTILSGLRYLRKSLWANAIFSFAIIAIPLSSWYRSGKWLDSPWSLTWPMFLMVMTPADQNLRRWECFLLGALVATGIVLNLGIVGTGTPTRVVADCAYMGAFAWTAVQWRRRQTEPSANPL